MPIRLIHGAAFDPETTQLLAQAYERACETVAVDDAIREIVAKRIIEAARRGERNLDRLVEYATQDGKTGNAAVC
jgi:hypothetical protein